MQGEIKQAHTPGPWRAVRGDDIVFVEAVNVAHIGVTNGKADEAPFVVQAAPKSSGSLAHNALLIAAAPDLLAALKAHDAYMLDACYSGPESSALHPKAAENWVRVRAAIAKATGAANA